MPCWQTIENAVDLGACDRATLIDALKDLGWTPIVNGDLLSFETEYGAAQISGGQVIMRGSSAGNADIVRDKVKQGVMAQATIKAANKFGWKHSKSTINGKTKIKLKRG